MQDLFSQQDAVLSPLADRMRPRTLDEFIGQRHIVGPGRLLRRAIEADRMTSSIFYGPPGCGKTTLASIIANTTHSAFVQLNAVTSGVADVRKVIKEAQDRRSLYGQSTYLLLDECHRWSKSQSDSILPAIERGVVRFIGSTTENPLISMTPAIVSRCRIFEFKPLTDADVRLAMRRALDDRERGFGNKQVVLDEAAAAHIAHIAGGDVRSALGALELAVLTTDPDEAGCIHVTLAVAEESIQKPVIRCDESLYYDMLSAFCKSMRGSDSDAALAWFARLLYAGVDPRLIARRIIAHASEDVGLANPTAMLQAVAAAQALEMVGLPEARLSLAQAIIAVCESPKSNSVVSALTACVSDAEKGGFQPVPVHLRDTHYAGHERLGSGAQYKYPHDYPGHWVPQEYMPPEVKGRKYYTPSDQGQELKLRERRKTRGIVD
ncbi:MAG: replication-associated recombination protein A [Clostridiales bacterium]|nr:replication-associated recombination protein A [Clostridiales bacterium]MDY5515507.1 replication-associated recombination protein A [Candidatus Ventricola sp.]